MKKNLLFSSLLAVIFQVTAQVPNYVPTDSLIGFWDFNGNLTNSLSSGIVLSTTGSNSYTQDRNGNASSALSSGAAIQNSINGFNATQQFTIGGWVNPYLIPFSNMPGNYIGYFYRMEYEVNNMYGPPTVGLHTEFAFLSDFVLNGPTTPVQGPDYGKIYFYTVIGGVTRFLKSSTNYNSNTWYHVLVSYDQSFLRLYVNGVCTDSLAATGNLNYSNFNGGFQQTQFQTYVNHGNGNYSSTLLDKMGFWRRALQPCEVLNLFEESATNCETTSTNVLSHSSASSIRCYPNPANDIVMINGLSMGEKVSIIALTGEVVLEQIVQQEITPLNISNLASGIYLVRFENRTPLKINILH